MSIAIINSTYMVYVIKLRRLFHPSPFYMFMSPSRLNLVLANHSRVHYNQFHTHGDAVISGFSVLIRFLVVS